MQLRSTAYRRGGAIPSKYARDGENLSPDFSWSDVPSRTKSLALILHDPDAPRPGGFTHWLMYGIDPAMRQIEESVSRPTPHTDFGIQGRNDTGALGYTGPFIPSGSHRYTARLYALDIDPDLQPGATRRELESAIEGHILDQAAFTGTYAKSASSERETSAVAA